MSETTTTWLVALNAASTWALTGMIWFVQVVHYPLFRVVEPSHFPPYQLLNIRLTAVVTAPLMVLEAVTTVWLLFCNPDVVPHWAAWIGIGLLAVVWANTAVQVVPTHVRLQEAFDERLYLRLLWTNLIRTVAWTARAALLLAVIRTVMR